MESEGKKDEGPVPPVCPQCAYCIIIVLSDLSLACPGFSTSFQLCNMTPSRWLLILPPPPTSPPSSEIRTGHTDSFCSEAFVILSFPLAPSLRRTRCSAMLEPGQGCEPPPGPLPSLLPPPGPRCRPRAFPGVPVRLGAGPQSEYLVWSFSSSSVTRKI